MQGHGRATRRKRAERYVCECGQRKRAERDYCAECEIEFEMRRRIRVAEIAVEAAKQAREHLAWMGRAGKLRSQRARSQAARRAG